MAGCVMAGGWDRRKEKVGELEDRTMVIGRKLLNMPKPLVDRGKHGEPQVCVEAGSDPSLVPPYSIALFCDGRRGGWLLTSDDHLRDISFKCVCITLPEKHALPTSVTPVTSDSVKPCVYVETSVPSIQLFLTINWRLYSYYIAIVLMTVFQHYHSIYWCVPDDSGTCVSPITCFLIPHVFKHDNPNSSIILCYSYLTVEKPSLFCMAGKEKHYYS